MHDDDADVDGLNEGDGAGDAHSKRGRRVHSKLGPRSKRGYAKAIRADDEPLPPPANLQLEGPATAPASLPYLLAVTCRKLCPLPLLLLPSLQSAKR